jgi:hypothetical protein
LYFPLRQLALEERNAVACCKFWDERPMQRVAVAADAKDRPNRGTESLQNDERGNGPERYSENTAFCLE